jgi:hypothetical protein
LHGILNRALDPGRTHDDAQVTCIAVMEARFARDLSRGFGMVITETARIAATVERPS